MEVGVYFCWGYNFIGDHFFDWTGMWFHSILLRVVCSYIMAKIKITRNSCINHALTGKSVLYNSINIIVRKVLCSHEFSCSCRNVRLIFSHLSAHS